MDQSFNRAAALRFRPIELKAVHGLLRRLLEEPDELLGHLRRCELQIAIMTTRWDAYLSSQNGG